ncbi:histidinol-phosphatase [Neorhodopirellula pilleata]|uniref:Histidinol-phosphatase n=1 Tax=Neorhodopirellula pilleata TaxID=2714738 RepID=A0A5C5ZYJ0_9BACT|nr:Histidinol-phosphatase [Neorhodopirellula pilleata]
MSSTANITQDWALLHEGRLAALVDVAIAAGEVTLQHFRKHDLVVDRKGDNSPVTVADREAEQKTRTLLSERFSGDTIAGEEFSEQSGESEYRWTVDPIDGTKSFICGVPLYSTLLALEHRGEPLAGIILIPALNQAVVAATGQGCFYTDDLTTWTAAKVSSQSNLSDAVFVTSEVKTFATRGDDDVYRRLEKSCFLTRTWGDGYGYLMVATGKADLMVDPICNAWDVAAMVPILTESGGRFTDWKGVETIRGGEGLGTNGRLHEEALKLVRST